MRKITIAYSTIAFLGAAGLLAVLVSQGTISGTATAPQPATTLASITVGEFATHIATQEPIIIDVRTPEEYAAGHLTGAINVDFRAPDFTERIEALARDGSYALYCRSGNRSGQALELMRSLGFSSVKDLSGGIIAWQAANNDVCQNC